MTVPFLVQISCSCQKTTTMSAFSFVCSICRFVHTEILQVKSVTRKKNEIKCTMKKNVLFFKNKITWSIFMTKNEKGRESLLVYILTLTCSSATPLLCPLLRPIDSLAPFCVLAARSSSRASLSYPSVSLTSLLVFLRG